MWALDCGTFVYATPLHPAPRPLVPRPAESVQVFSGAPPAEPYVDVALLEVEQDDGYDPQSDDYTLLRLREKAGELGCDAIFIKALSESETEAAARGLHDTDTRHVLASCIAYTRPASTRPTA